MRPLKDEKQGLPFSMKESWNQECCYSNIKICTTVPLKSKMTVPRASILEPRDSILDPRKFRVSSLESRGSSLEVRVSSLESRKIMSLSLDWSLEKLIGQIDSTRVSCTATFNWRAGVLCLAHDWNVSNFRETLARMISVVFEVQRKLDGTNNFDGK